MDFSALPQEKEPLAIERVGIGISVIASLRVRLDFRMSALPPIVFSNSGSGCQALHDHPCRAHCSLRGRGVPSA
jgi:hypothetical protein